MSSLIKCLGYIQKHSPCFSPGDLSKIYIYIYMMSNREELMDCRVAWTETRLTGCNKLICV